MKSAIILAFVCVSYTNAFLLGLVWPNEKAPDSYGNI